MTLKEIMPLSLVENPFDVFSNKWALVTAGTLENYNMMTIGWGTIGILWRKPIAIVFVRPSRYTYEFMEQQDMFSITTFDKSFRKVLNLCGTKSGRDISKMEIKELTPMESENSVFFKEAEMVLLCKKIYFQDFIPERIPDDAIKRFYDSGDFHRVYYGEILKCLHK